MLEWMNETRGNEWMWIEWMRQGEIMKTWLIDQIFVQMGINYRVNYWRILVCAFYSMDIYELLYYVKVCNKLSSMVENVELIDWLG